MIFPDATPGSSPSAAGRTLTDSDHRLLALWAATCAEHVLHLFESAQPSDARAPPGDRADTSMGARRDQDDQRRRRAVDQQARTVPINMGRHDAAAHHDDDDQHHDDGPPRSRRPRRRRSTSTSTSTSTGELDHLDEPTSARQPAGQRRVRDQLGAERGSPRGHRATRVDQPDGRVRGVAQRHRQARQRRGVDDLDGPGREAGPSASSRPWRPSLAAPTRCRSSQSPSDLVPAGDGGGVAGDLAAVVDVEGAGEDGGGGGVDRCEHAIGEQEAA